MRLSDTAPASGVPRLRSACGSRAALARQQVSRVVGGLLRGRRGGVPGVGGRAAVAHRRREREVEREQRVDHGLVARLGAARGTDRRRAPRATHSPSSIRWARPWSPSCSTPKRRRATPHRAPDVPPARSAHASRGGEEQRAGAGAPVVRVVRRLRRQPSRRAACRCRGRRRRRPRRCGRGRRRARRWSPRWRPGPRRRSAAARRDSSSATDVSRVFRRACSASAARPVRRLGRRPAGDRPRWKPGRVGRSEPQPLEVVVEPGERERDAGHVEAGAQLADLGGDDVDAGRSASFSRNPPVDDEQLLVLHRAEPVQQHRRPRSLPSAGVRPAPGRPAGRPARRRSAASTSAKPGSPWMPRPIAIRPSGTVNSGVRRAGQRAAGERDAHRAGAVVRPARERGHLVERRDPRPRRLRRP